MKSGKWIEKKNKKKTENPGEINRLLKQFHFLAELTYEAVFTGAVTSLCESTTASSQACARARSR